MKQLRQIRVPSKMLREYLLEEAILIKIKEILSDEIEPTFSLGKRHLLLVDEFGKITALPFERQWKTLERLYEEKERIRFHITLDEKLLNDNIKGQKSD